MKHRRRGRIALRIAAYTLVIAAIWWFLAFIFDDSRDFRRCSLDYWFLVPDSIHRLPMDYCSGPARYTYDMLDGLAPLRVGRYCHTSDPSTAIAHYQDLLLKRGYRGPDREIGAYDREHLYFHQDDHVLELRIVAPDEFTITYLWG